MNRWFIIITVVSIILICTAIANPHSISQLPWDMSLSIKKNLTPYIVTVIVFTACYQTISTIYLAFSDGSNSSQTKRVIGKILHIEHSGLTVNNRPRFKIRAEYGSTIKTFDNLSEQVQFHLKVGDSAVIYQQPNIPSNAYLNIEETMEYNKTPVTAPSNAMFKIIDITPNFAKGTNMYQITGEVHMNKGNLFKASIIQTLTPQQATGINPGKLVSCLAEEEKGKVISMTIGLPLTGKG